MRDGRPDAIQSIGEILERFHKRLPTERAGFGEKLPDRDTVLRQDPLDRVDHVLGPNVVESRQTGEVEQGVIHDLVHSLLGRVHIKIRS